MEDFLKLTKDVCNYDDVKAVKMLNMMAVGFIPLLMSDEKLKETNLPEGENGELSLSKSDFTDSFKRMFDCQKVFESCNYILNQNYKNFNDLSDMMSDVIQTSCDGRNEKTLHLSFFLIIAMFYEFKQMEDKKSLDLDYIVEKYFSNVVKDEIDTIMKELNEKVARGEL